MIQTAEMIHEVELPGHESKRKGAITAFTRSLSENLIEDGIRVNARRARTHLDAAQSCGGTSEEKLENIWWATPMGRPGQPYKISPAFLFLACEDSSYLSGQVVHPSGGTIVNG